MENSLLTELRELDKPEPLRHAAKQQQHTISLRRYIMGGKNHQPCRNYLMNSTRMSRAFSLSLIALEQANVELEDLILIELENGIGNVKKITDRLEECLSSLSKMRTVVQDLREQMLNENYVDLASVCSLDLDSLGNELSSAHLTDSVAWSLLSSMMRSDGFYGVLHFFDAQIVSIEHAVTDLTEKVQALSSSASVGAVNVVLEENLPGNIRYEFAKTYTLFNEFNAQFLASALISTSLWYAQMGYRALRDSVTQSDANLARA